MKQWQIDYKGHSIVVQNSVSKERLFVDGELQHENFGIGIRSCLFGKIKSEDEAGSEVKVILGGLWRVHCRVFVDHQIVYHSNPDKLVADILNRIKN